VFGFGNLRAKSLTRKAVTGSQMVKLDFLGSTSMSGSLSYATYNLVPGYAYARGGAMGVHNLDGSVSNFAIGAIPLVAANGVFSYGAANNRLIRSQDFSAAGWSATGNTGTNPVVTVDQAVAPDGTTTADKIVFSAVSGAGKVSNVIRSFTSFNGAQSASVYLKGNAGGENIYIWLLNGTTYIRSARITLTTGWQRFVLPATLNGASWSFGIGCDLRDTGGQVATAACTVFAWQAQVLDGSFPDGGPLVFTAAAAMNTFTPDLKCGLESGSYTATYTFDDDSTQNVSITITDAKFRLATYPSVLNRPRIKSVNVVPA
jgi:hypothetical protein